MPRHRGETSKTWLERAIVANALAGDEQVRMEESPVVYNSVARASILQRAAYAASDVRAAKEAVSQDRAHS